jgi:hypothetical protein
MHTATRVVWACIVLGKEVLYLPLLLSSGIGIFYLPFQFPIIGLLLIVLPAGKFISSGNYILIKWLKSS